MLERNVVSGTGRVNGIMYVVEKGDRNMVVVS